MKTSEFKAQMKVIQSAVVSCDETACAVVTVVASDLTEDQRSAFNLCLKEKLEWTSCKIRGCLDLMRVETRAEPLENLRRTYCRLIALREVVESAADASAEIAALS